MGKADAFFSDDQGTMESNFGLRPKGHVPTAFDVASNEDSRLTGTKRDMNAKVIAVARIIAKEQVRKDFDETELNELAHSLKTVGQKTPILVYWSEEDDKYVIIAGERRYRAALIAEIAELTCQVHPHKPDEAELVELQFVENAIRSDLNPIEEAQSYQKLQELKGFSANQLAERIGKNQSTISRSLALLKLPVGIQENVAKGRIPVSVAREIVKLPSEAAQERMAADYLAGELTTTQAQAQTNNKHGKDKKGKSSINAKKWTHEGITISVTYSRGVTLSDIADAMEDRAKTLRNDGRGKKAA